VAAFLASPGASYVTGALAGRRRRAAPDGRDRKPRWEAGALTGRGCRSA